MRHLSCSGHVSIPHTASEIQMATINEEIDDLRSVEEDLTFQLGMPPSCDSWFVFLFYSDWEVEDLDRGM